MHYVAEYSACAFGCTLCGPFNKLLSAGFSAPRLSVSAYLIFISASTVCTTFPHYIIEIFICQAGCQKNL